MYKNNEEICGNKTCSSTGCYKSKHCKIVLEKEKIIDRWAEQISELFEDHRKDYNVMKCNLVGSPIMKATGPDYEWIF